MLDRDLAMLYGVSAKQLNQAVKRNVDRFPKRLHVPTHNRRSEGLVARSNYAAAKVTNCDLKRGQHFKYRPYAFTEQGVAMLSSVLRSKRAVSVNVEIMRTFVRLRQMLGTNDELARKPNALEQKYDRQFRVVFDAIRQLMSPAPVPRKEIGFRSKSTKK